MIHFEIKKVISKKGNGYMILDGEGGAIFIPDNKLFEFSLFIWNSLPAW